MRYNLIVIVADTFRADHLGCYGNDWIKTPSLDQMAQQGVVFENCYADGLPTIPARRVFFTGNSIIPREIHGGWTPLRQDDLPLPVILRDAGFRTGFVTDTYHYFKPGQNFHQGFDSWRWIRGQEFDPWISGPKNEFDPHDHIPDHLWNENYDEMTRQYMMNTCDRQHEEDYFCAQTFQEAGRWLEHNANESPFMLWVDTFDPHEPWDAPFRFQQMYRQDYPFERTLFGYGVNGDDIKERDLPVLKALYAAEVSFVDMWIGRLLDRVDELGLAEDTIIVFTTDHGTHLGEDGYVQKNPAQLDSRVSHMPLIVRHPDSSLAGTRVDSLVSATDLAPGFVDMLDVQETPEMDGDSFWRVAAEPAETNHDDLYIEFGPFGAVHNFEWHYFQPTSEENASQPACLYNLQGDQEETKNVASDYPEVVTEPHSKLKKRMGQNIPEPQLPK
ncbi:MAG: sulfatase [Planctomycetes bacterium]|nr:sulfatase [Planctomycetota bacterium]